MKSRSLAGRKTKRRVGRCHHCRKEIRDSDQYCVCQIENEAGLECGLAFHFDGCIDEHRKKTSHDGFTFHAPEPTECVFYGY